MDLRAPFWVPRCSLSTVSPPAEVFMGIMSMNNKLVQNLQRGNRDLILLPFLPLHSFSSSLVLLPRCSFQHLLQDTTRHNKSRTELSIGRKVWNIQILVVALHLDGSILELQLKNQIFTVLFLFFSPDKYLSLLYLLIMSLLGEKFNWKEKL